MSADNPIGVRRKLPQPLLANLKEAFLARKKPKSESERYERKKLKCEKDEYYDEPHSTTTKLTRSKSAPRARYNHNDKAKSEIKYTTTQIRTVRSSSLSRLQHMTASSSNEKEKAKVISVNALRLLKEYTTFLKFGRYGSPGCRNVRLSTDHRYIEYISRRKNIGNVRFPISSITKIQHGRNTKNFKRFPEKAILDQASFSILYSTDEKNLNSASRSLDLVAQCKADYLLWTDGLSKVLSVFKSNNAQNVPKLESIAFDMPVSATYVIYASMW